MTDPIRGKITWLDEGIEEEAELHKEPANKGEVLLNAEGDKLYIKADGPHGFLKVFSSRGPVPQALAGQSWTDLRLCRAAVEKYVKENVSSVKMNPKGEPAKVKSEARTKAKATRVANKAENFLTEEPNGEADTNGPSVSSE